MTGETIYVLGSVSFGWLHENMGAVFDEPFFMQPAVRHERSRTIHRFVEQTFPRYEIYCAEANLVQVEFWRANQVLVGGIQPNLILGAALGAPFRFFGDKDPDIDAAPLANLEDVGALRGMDWQNVHPIRRFLEQIDRLRAGGDARARAIPPFFWDVSGTAVFHGPITTGQKLMGERIYIECLERPRLVHELLDWIADAYVTLARLLASRAGLTITSVHIGECSACMIGPEQFREFSLPACRKIINALGPARLHSCGHSDHLLEAFAELPNLRTINTGSNTSVARMRAVLGGDYPIEIAPDARMLSFGTPADVREWVERTLAENKGGPLVFVYHLDLGYPVENVLAIHDLLIERGMIRPGRHRQGARS